MYAIIYNVVMLFDVVLVHQVTLSHVTDVGVYATMATDQDVKHEDEIIRVSDPRSR